MTALVEASGLALAGRLEPTDLALAGGGLTMLVGPNGAGKTSLLRALAGIGASRGTVAIDGEPLAGLPSARRMTRLTFLGASRDVAWPLAARDYVALGLPGGDRSRADAALAALEAGALAPRRLDRLSTGERTRVMLARALAPGARLLLLDEPCANLDPKWQLAVVDRLREESRRGAAVLMSVHDLGIALAHGDRVIVVDRGRIVADGPPRDALDPATVARVFGVERDGEGRWRRRGA